MSLPVSAWPAAMTSPSTAASRIHRCDEIAGLVELGGGADPVGVHRHRQRGRRGVAGQAALAGGQLGQVEAPAAEVLGHGGGQVADLAQFGEVLVEVAVGAIELAGSGCGSAPACRSAARRSRWRVMVVVVLMAATIVDRASHRPPIG